MTGKEPDLLIRIANGIAGGLFALVFLLTVAKHVLAKAGSASIVLKWAIYVAIILVVLHGCQSYIQTGAAAT